MLVFHRVHAPSLVSVTGSNQLGYVAGVSELDARLDDVRTGSANGAARDVVRRAKII